MTNLLLSFMYLYLFYTNKCGLFSAAATYTTHSEMVIFQVLTVSSLKITALWDVVQCSLVDDGGSNHI